MDDRRFPARPVPGVGALIIDGNRILLVERGREPLKGYIIAASRRREWKRASSSQDALRREVLEETGLEIEIVRLLRSLPKSASRPAGDGRTEYHFILLDYICVPTGGTLCAADDASRAEWFTEDEVAAGLTVKRRLRGHSGGHRESLRMAARKSAK